MSNRRSMSSILKCDRESGRVDDLQLQLESEIKKAYMLKALDAQLAEQEANRLFVKGQSKIFDQISKYENDQEQQELDRHEKLRKLRNKHDLAEGLERQMRDKELEREVNEEQERKERLVLMQVDKIREEEEKLNEILSKEELSDQLIIGRLIHREFQEIAKQEETESETARDEMIERYRTEKQKRHEDLKRLHESQMKRRDEMIIKVANILMKCESEVTERKSILIELMTKDVKDDLEIEKKKAELIRKQVTNDLVASWKEQLEYEEDCKRQFLEREKEFFESVMKKVMESEKIEQSTLQMRKLKRIEYKKELERLMSERQKTREEELVKLQLFSKEESKKEEMARQEAMRRRKMLLEEHKDHVGEYMNRIKLFSEENLILKRDHQ